MPAQSKKTSRLPSVAPHDPWTSTRIAQAKPPLPRPPIVSTPARSPKPTLSLQSRHPRRSTVLDTRRIAPSSPLYLPRSAGKAAAFSRRWPTPAGSTHPLPLKLPPSRRIEAASALKFGRAHGSNLPVDRVELLAVLPDYPLLERTAMTSWDDPKVRDALPKAGRKKVVVAGLWTEVCTNSFALSATFEGGDEI